MEKLYFLFIYDWKYFYFTLFAWIWKLLAKSLFFIKIATDFNLNNSPLKDKIVFSKSIDPFFVSY